MWYLTTNDKTQLPTARSLFERAIALDPEFASPYCGLAATYFREAYFFNVTGFFEGLGAAEPIVRKAISVDAGDANARASLAEILFLKGDHDGAVQEANNAFLLNSNCAQAISVKGVALCFSGHGREGRDLIRQYLKWSPRSPNASIRINQLATSLYLEGDYENALREVLSVIRQFPQNTIPYRTLAATLGQLGKTREARDALKTFLEAGPFAVEKWIRQGPPWMKPSDHQHIVAGLRKAGWNE
jgi:adenylate cyclase